MDAPLWDRAVAAVRERLSEPAFEHSMRVAETAVALASVYSVDKDKAMLAGLLHDWDKELGAEALIASATSYGVPVSDVERDSPYLLHALTGARAVRDTFPDLDREVVSAIACHTLGATEMSDLDIVVWVADMIEPGRCHEGLDSLRELVGIVALHTLFSRAYERSVAHVIERRRPLHPKTVGVWNAHVARWHRD